MSRSRRTRSARQQSSIGDWRDEVWNRHFAELCEYRDRFGDVRVPSHWRGNPQLASWVSIQRKMWRRGELESDRAKRLDQIGFAWEIGGFDRDTRERHFADMLARLAAFREKYGHVGVTPSRDEELSGWIINQRENRKNGRINADRLRRLDEAGFPWEAVDALWEEQYQRLIAYRDRFGHTRVPARWPEDVALGQWCFHQRKLWRDGVISADHASRLDAIDFTWSVSSRDRASKERRLAELLARLAEYRKRYGHAGVIPGRDFELWDWIAKQRENRSKGLLKPERIRLLDRAGFPWKHIDHKWEEHYQRLAAYRKRFGHTRVPARWPENVSLGQWCYYQRKKWRRGLIHPDHVRRLDRLGFEWEVPAGNG